MKEKSGSPDSDGNEFFDGKEHRCCKCKKLLFKTKSLIFYPNKTIVFADGEFGIVESKSEIEIKCLKCSHVNIFKI